MGISESHCVDACNRTTQQLSMRDGNVSMCSFLTPTERRLAYADEVAGRILEAFADRQARAKTRRERYTQADLGRGVAKRLRRTEDFAQPTVARWMAKDSPALPDDQVPTLRAIAEELGVSEEWLVLGKGPKVADPPPARLAPPPTREELAALEERLREKNETPPERGNRTRRRPA